MGPEKIVEAFKHRSGNNKAIIEYISGDFEKLSPQDLRKFAKSHVSDWEKIRQRMLSEKLRHTALHNKLIEGYHNVRNELMAGRGQLLFIEKQLLLNQDRLDNAFNERIYEKYSRFSCIKNPMDELIEKVLEGGGNVDLVDDGFLNEHGKIALIKN